MWNQLIQNALLGQYDSFTDKIKKTQLVWACNTNGR